jgi:hypothetical protein
MESIREKSVFAWCQLHPGYISCCVPDIVKKLQNCFKQCCAIMHDTPTHILIVSAHV